MSDCHPPKEFNLQMLLLVAFLAAGRPFFHFHMAAFTSFAVSEVLAEAFNLAGPFFMAFLAVRDGCLVCLVVELDVLFHLDHISSKG